MSQLRRIGVSYGRFSDPAKQGQGDSEDRQERMYRDFCQHHNLTPLTEVFMDRGRSGYRDEHRKKGRLGVLISYAKDGRFEPKTVIVVEAWDRLGRLRPDKQTDLVRELLETGVDIGVCQLNDVFTLDDFGTHKWIVLSTFIMLAFQESKQKAERVAASYEKRRKLAREGKQMPPRREDGRASKLITDQLPFWLEAFGEGCRPIPERVAAVKRIFALAGQGYGRARIVAALVAEEIPSFGTGGKWTRSYVNKILNNRRVLGEYQPRRAISTLEGEPIADYYPAVVSEKEWLLARAGQEARRGKDRLGRALVRTERKWVNLFRGLLVNALDGEGFQLNQKVEGGKRRFVLCSAAGMAGRGKVSTFPYQQFEDAFLGLVKEVNSADILPRANGAMSQADILKVQLDNVRSELASVQDDLRRGYSRRLSDLLREHEAEETRLADAYQEELARSAQPAEKAWNDLPELVDLIKSRGDEARLKLRPVLRRVAEGVWVVIVRRGSYLLAMVQVFFHGGARREWLIANQSAGRNRKGGLTAGSFPASLVAGGIDLRTMEGARKIEEALESAPLPSQQKP